MEESQKNKSALNACTLIIVDDDSTVRALLRSILNDSAARVLGEADNGMAGIEMAERLNPDIAIFDVSMPQTNGFTAVRQLRKQMPHVQIIFVSEHTHQAYLDEAFEIGANGYVSKRKASRDLPDAVQAVLSGQTFISPSITAKSGR